MRTRSVVCSSYDTLARLTSCSHEQLVQSVRQERIGQGSEVRFEDGGDRVDVVEPINIVEVEGIVIALLKQLGDGFREG
jgi:hypothetical protein